MDYKALRKIMLEEQLLARGIKDERVLYVFSKLERHNFIPQDFRNIAYADSPVPIGDNQTISQPYIVALMTECLALSGKEKVLEIGTGSGYQAAILAELAKEVCSIERHPGLAKRAQTHLKELGYKNIKIKTGDGTMGWLEEAPFDRIIITAASPRVPLPLMEQLKSDGKLLLPLGESPSQILTLLEKKENKIITKEICSCVFVPLIGKFGYPE